MTLQNFRGVVELEDSDSNSHFSSQGSNFSVEDLRKNEFGPLSVKNSRGLGNIINGKIVTIYGNKLIELKH